MEPTLDVHDRIVVDRLGYDLHHVARGDVVSSTNRPTTTAVGHLPYLVKRVIGLPREQISSSGGLVLVDGKPSQERSLPEVDPLAAPSPPLSRRGTITCWIVGASSAAA